MAQFLSAVSRAPQRFCNSDDVVTTSIGVDFAFERQWTDELYQGLPYFQLPVVGEEDDEQSRMTSVHGLTIDSPSEWLQPRLAALAKLRMLAHDWDSAGAAPPNDTAIKMAAAMLNAFSRWCTAPQSVAPSTEDGVRITFRDGSRFAEVECFNAGDVLAVTSRDKNDATVWDVREVGIRETARRITQFLAIG